MFSLTNFYVVKRNMIRFGWYFLPFVVMLGACERQPRNEASTLPPAEVPAETAVAKPVPQVLPESDTAWVNLADHSDRIIVDMRYATPDNFVDTPIYPCGACYVRAAVARGLLAAEADLKKEGLRLKFYDCYRPEVYQQVLWDQVPDPRYVTPPGRGSMHSRGAAVDLTLADEQGAELDMGTSFDYFGKEAWHNYTGHSEQVLANRKKLRTTMENNGFKGISTEWWHYSYRSGRFPVSSWQWPCQ